jgi:hypothetical protein
MILPHPASSTQTIEIIGMESPAPKHTYDKTNLPINKEIEPTDRGQFQSL